MLENTKEKINAETAKVYWQEIQSFFASGSVVFVSQQCDLVEVAYQMACNNSEQIKQWMESGLVCVVSDKQAAQWHEDQQLLWAVVIKPWILVQEV